MGCDHQHDWANYHTAGNVRSRKFHECVKIKNFVVKKSQFHSKAAWSLLGENISFHKVKIPQMWPNQKITKFKPHEIYSLYNNVDEPWHICTVSQHKYTVELQDSNKVTDPIHTLQVINIPWRLLCPCTDQWSLLQAGGRTAHHHMKGNTEHNLTYVTQHTFQEHRNILRT